MATDRRRITISLDDDLAERVPDTGSASAWINDCIRRATDLDLTDDTAADLRQLVDSVAADRPLDAAAALATQALGDGAMALTYLRAAGLEPSEILAVMNAMMGTLWQHGVPIGQQLALEMHDAVRLGAVDLERWGVSPERWGGLVGMVRGDSEIGRALLDVARVFWRASGSPLERALWRGMERPERA